MLQGHKADKSSITILDKLGVLLDNSTTAAIQLLEDVLGLACNACGWAIENRRVHDLAVHDLHLKLAIS
jgi:hypothetical protein